jgi:hypothetical protein
MIELQPTVKTIKIVLYFTGGKVSYKTIDPC